MAELRTTPIYRALHRPLLLWGGERHLVLLALLVCALIGTTALHLWIVGLAIVLWGILQSTLVQLAKMDADLSQVFLRAIRYQRFYPAFMHKDAPSGFVFSWKL